MESFNKNVLYINVSLYSLQALFPDNTYGVDSGGDPQVIPKLTFEEFKVCCICRVDLLFPEFYFPSLDFKYSSCFFWFG